MRVTGSISRRDLAMLFARAADLGEANPRSARMGKQLLERMLARSSELVRDERPAPPVVPRAPSPPSPPRPPRAPDADGFDLTDLTRSMDGVLAGSGPRDEPPTDPLPVRRQRGKMGLETLQELFVRGGQVRFDGYLDELEHTLEELYQRFRHASREYGITAEDLERGDLLGDGGDLLESRRAARKARRGGADLPSSGRWPAAGPAPEAPAPVSPGPVVPAPPRAPTPPPVAPLPVPMTKGSRPPVVGTASLIGEFWPDEPAGVKVSFARPGVFSVQCGCGKERAIDTRSLPPWRIRCKSCRQVLFDPTTTLLLGEDAPSGAATGADPGPASPPGRAGEVDPFARFLRSSAELTELKAAELERCARHPAQAPVATCNRCGKQLCRACLDQVGNAFGCASCLETQAPPAPAPLPVPPALERPPTPAEVRRAFERALLMAAQEGDLERPGAPGVKRVRLIYDHQRRLFKVPLELRLQPGDRVRLSDGRQISIRAVREWAVDGVACYQEVAWLPLG